MRSRLLAYPTVLLLAVATMTVLAAAVAPWARYGPGLHWALGLCVVGSDCSHGVPGPPQTAMIVLAVMLLLVGGRAAVRADTAVVLATVALVILLALDTWAIQIGYARLGMEIREVGFYLAPVGVALAAIWLIVEALRRHFAVVAVLMGLLLLVGGIAEFNLLRPPIYHCPGRNVGSSYVTC